MFAGVLRKQLLYIAVLRAVAHSFETIDEHELDGSIPLWKLGQVLNLFQGRDSFWSGNQSLFHTVDPTILRCFFLPFEGTDSIPLLFLDFCCTSSNVLRTQKESSSAVPTASVLFIALMNVAS